MDAGEGARKAAAAARVAMVSDGTTGPAGQQFKRPGGWLDPGEDKRKAHEAAAAASAAASVATVVGRVFKRPSGGYADAQVGRDGL